MGQNSLCILYWDECLIKSISDSLGIRSWNVLLFEIQKSSVFVVN